MDTLIPMVGHLYKLKKEYVTMYSSALPPGSLFECTQQWSEDTYTFKAVLEPFETFVLWQTEVDEWLEAAVTMPVEDCQCGTKADRGQNHSTWCSHYEQEL